MHLALVKMETAATVQFCVISITAVKISTLHHFIIWILFICCVLDFKIWNLNHQLQYFLITHHVNWTSHEFLNKKQFTSDYLILSVKNRNVMQEEQI